jgi:tetratricopeptide (TPR) repeat protein
MKQAVRLCGFASWLLLAAVAAGDEARAQDHYDEGVALYRSGRYAEAAAAFARAHGEDQQPKYLYNRAQAERLAGDCDAALEGYRAFVALEPPEAQRRQAEDNIAACQAAIAERAPPRDPAPLEEPAPAAPPPALPPPALPPPAGPPAPPALAPAPEPDEVDPAPSRFSDPLGITLLASGIAALGAGAGVLGWSFVVEGDAADGGVVPGGSYSEHEALVERAEIARTAGIVVMACGAALATGAALRFALLPDGSISGALAPGALRLRARF